MRTTNPNRTAIQKLLFCLGSAIAMCTLALAITSGSAGCGDNGGNGGSGGGGGGGGGAGGGGGGSAQVDMAGPGCSSNPMTHEEIINACTDSQAVDIMPFYPSQAPGGVLPPLPN
jgi:hypothetical protein